MRLGLDLRKQTVDDAIAIAVDADRLGIWAVLITGPAGTEASVAAEIAVATEHVHLAVQLDPGRAHPQGLAEEIAILDHLSARRAIAVINGDDATGAVTDQVRRLLAGEVVDGAVLAPPPAQTAVTTWAASAVAAIELSDDLAAARNAVDELRDAGTAHAFAGWPGPTAVFARHLATRARTPDFPDLVADYADTIAPLSAAPENGEATTS